MKNKLKQKIINKENILYTGYGDNGTTTLYDCKQMRISKSNILIEALGSVDELNSYLGIVKVYSDIEKLSVVIGNKKFLYSNILGEIQQTLFVIQAELGGSKMSVKKKDLNFIEKIIEDISKKLPPIKSFTVSGGSVLSAELDYSRTLARRAERRIIGVIDEKSRNLSKSTISYMNRLSSVLFAMSRYSNHIFSIKEEHPDYK